jgi:hypothetical protein
LIKLTGSNYKVFTAIFLQLFLVLISMSVFLFPFHLQIPTYLILILVTIITTIISRKIGKKMLLSLTIFTGMFHIWALWYLLPIGSSLDQRLHYINAIANSGRISSLNKYLSDGLFYVDYPIPWLIALTVNLISNISQSISLLLTYLSTYLCMIILLTKLCSNSSIDKLALLVITIMTTVYLHRPFQDLVASSYGILSIVIALYLLIIRKRFNSVLLMLIIPLFMAYGSSIYIIIFLFSLLAIININKISASQAVRYGLIVFSGTWFYQIGTGLINFLIEQSVNRWDQLSSIITDNILDRPITSSIMEQSTHFIYWFDNIIVPIAYILPALLSFISLIYFLHRFYKYRNEFDGMLLANSMVCVILFVIAGIFAWKGLENAIARYAYLFAAPLSVIVNVSLLAFLTQKQKILVIFLTMLLVLGLAIETESFYTPYSSLIASPDYSKFSLLIKRQYTDSTLSFSNMGMMLSLEFRYSGNLFYMTPYMSHPISSMGWTLNTDGNRLYDNYFVSFYSV